MPLKDQAHVTDEVAAGLAPSAAPPWPCPKCGAAGKADHDGRSICSRRECRHKYPRPTDEVAAGLAPPPPASPWPCPKCGAAGKEDHDGRNICSRPGCRHKYPREPRDG